LDFSLSIKQKQIRQMARQFAQIELAPIAKEIDAEARFPWEVVEKMASLNFFGMQAPREYGGAEVDSISYCLVIEEISRVCAAMGLTIAVHNSVVVFPISRFGNEDQKRRFLMPLARGEKPIAPSKKGPPKMGWGLNKNEPTRRTAKEGGG
jgi:butyryl-CoA dehydrogenase